VPHRFGRPTSTFQKALDNIDEVFAPTLSTPSCPLWEHSTKKVEKDKVDHLPLKNKLGLTAGSNAHSSDNAVTPIHPNPCTPTTAGTRGTMRKAPDTTSLSIDTCTKCQKLTNLGMNDVNGYLVWTGEGKNLPLPTELNSKDFSLCKAFWRMLDSGKR
jgi:hypothetical protein